MHVSSVDESIGRCSTRRRSIPLFGATPLIQILPSPVPGDRFVRLKFLQNSLALLLLAVWPVLSAHPVLQHLGLIHEARADHDVDSNGSHGHDDEGDHDGADGQCLPALTTVKVPSPQSTLTLFQICYFVTESAFDLERQQLFFGLAPPGTSPPEVSHRWQFSFRTALPARAPSFVS